jgi:hypothetical protein
LQPEFLDVWQIARQVMHEDFRGSSGYFKCNRGMIERSAGRLRLFGVEGDCRNWQSPW